MLNVTFLVPPVLVGKHPAERSSGCTHVVYPTPNIYELQVAACVEQSHRVTYIDCINHPQTMEQLLENEKTAATDVYMIWTVNLSVENAVPGTRCWLFLPKVPHR